MRALRWVVPTAALGMLFSGSALAGLFSVFVGYSDGLRGPGFFPNPWDGDPGIVFIGSAAPFDAGAIRIDNTSGAPLSIDSVAVTINGVSMAGAAPAVWATHFPLILAPGDKLILTQTTQYDFDTSDIAGIPGATYGNLALGCNGTGTDPNPAHICPTVAIGVNSGAPQTFNDSGHVLDTGGFDFAANGSNESFAWRPIGTFGGPAGGNAPEPATLTLVGIALAGLGLSRRQRKH